MDVKLYETDQYKARVRFFEDGTFFDITIRDKFEGKFKTNTVKIWFSSKEEFLGFVLQVSGLFRDILFYHYPKLVIKNIHEFVKTQQSGIREKFTEISTVYASRYSDEYILNERK